MAVASILTIVETKDWEQTGRKESFYEIRSDHIW